MKIKKKEKIAGKVSVSMQLEIEMTEEDLNDWNACDENYSQQDYIHDRIEVSFDSKVTLIKTDAKLKRMRSKAE